ncbi:MAG: Na+/H+ antiporter subunit E [Pseudomonadota bacterium]
MNTHVAHDRPDRKFFTPRALAWLLVTTAFWALLSGNSGWYVGLPVILVATATATMLDTRPWSLRPQYIPAFALFFFYNSLLGGWDVARRALRPGMPMDPAWRHYTLHTEDPGVRLALSAIVGLLPGTLASHIEGDTLHIHLLDCNSRWSDTVGALESHLIRVSGGGRAP